MSVQFCPVGLIIMLMNMYSLTQSLFFSVIIFVFILLKVELCWI